MEQAKRGDTVKVHYTGKLDDGTVFDSSEGKDPLEFKIGTNQIISGFQHGVVGMAVGDAKTINVPVDDAYGPRDEKLVAVIGHERFPQEMRPEIGQRLQLVQADQRKIFATVRAISESGVTIDANHLLAGKDLIFDIELVAIL